MAFGGMTSAFASRAFRSFSTRHPSLASLGKVDLNAVQANPAVLGLFPHGTLRRGKAWIRECAHGNADSGVLLFFDLPIERGAALRTKVRGEGFPRITRARKRARGALDRELLRREVGADSQDRARPPLALQAVAGHYRRGFAECGDLDRSA